MIENLVIVMFSGADEISLVNKEENIEDQESEHGEEINEAGADNSLRGDEKARGGEGEEGDEKENDELTGGVAHGGERGGEDERHGVESAARNDNEEREEMVGKGDGVEEFEDGDAEEPGGKKTDEAKGEDGEGEAGGEFGEAGEVLVEASFESHEKWLNDVLAEEGEDGGGHSDNAIDGLDFVGRDGVDGIFGSINKINSKKTKAKNEEAFFGQKPNFGEIGFFEMEVGLAETREIIKKDDQSFGKDEHGASEDEIVGKRVDNEEENERKNGF